MNFEFGDQTPGSGLAAGTGSDFFFIATHATHYAKTAMYDLADPGSYQDNGVEFASFAPSSGVPEPATLSLLTLGAALAPRFGGGASSERGSALNRSRNPFGGGVATSVQTAFDPMAGRIVRKV